MVLEIEQHHAEIIHYTARSTGNTEIGPVLEVKTICHLYGIEIRVPPPLETTPILVL